MDDEVRILIMSDLHLGIDSDRLYIPESVRLNTFRKITALALEHDILLVAGDLLDSPDPGAQLIDAVRSEFMKLQEKGVDIIYTPGRGELAGDGGISPDIGRLNASHVFLDPDSSPYLYLKGGQRIYLYGLPASMAFDVTKIRKASEQGFHLGLFYVDLDQGRDEYDPRVYKLSKSDIRKLDFDFYAFGYNHSFRMYKILDKIIGTYPGSPEAVSWRETGDRYVVSLSVKDDGISQIKRLSVNSIKILDLVINCDEVAGEKELMDKIEAGRSKRVVQRVTINGVRNFHVDDYQLRGLAGEFYHLEINDNSLPSVDLIAGDYDAEDTLRGEFFRILREKCRGKLPEGVDRLTISEILETIRRKGTDSMEEWMCSI